MSQSESEELLVGSVCGMGWDQSRMDNGRYPESGPPLPIHLQQLVSPPEGGSCERGLYHLSHTGLTDRPEAGAHSVPCLFFPYLECLPSPWASSLPHPCTSCVDFDPEAEETKAENTDKR